MISITDNGIITMNRGDYLEYPIFINAGDYINPLRYTLEGNDKLYFSIVEPNQPFEFGDVRKVLTKDDVNIHGDAVIVLNDSDTENLLPGTYYYEIKLDIVRNNKEYISTIVNRRKLFIY